VERIFEALDVPQELRANLELFLRLVRRVVREESASLLASFDELLCAAVVAGTPEASEVEATAALERAVAVVDELNEYDAELIVRAFTVFFHVANVCEEQYRAGSLMRREAAGAAAVGEACSVATIPAEKGGEAASSKFFRVASAPLAATAASEPAGDPGNDMTRGYALLAEERGRAKAQQVLERLEFRPVFTAHPTEARRKAMEEKIRRVGALLDERSGLAGTMLVENERRLLEVLSSMLRTSPISHRKPTPEEEANTLIDIFDHTLFDEVPLVYRRFNDWILGEKAGLVAPVCPAFFKPGSWIGTDRDGNPLVTARVSRKVAEKYREHALETFAARCEEVGRALTLDVRFTPPSDELNNLWNHQVEMSEALTSRASGMSLRERHRACMLVMAERLRATRLRTADLMYASSDEFVADLQVVQRSLVAAGATREAYGALQSLIWQVQSFGFGLVELEFRQHARVHARALEDIAAHGRWGERGELEPQTREVLDTFRAIGYIQRLSGVQTAARYIVSFTQRAEDIANVYKLARLAFAHAEDVPTLDVVPLFEQIKDLEQAPATLDEIIALPEVQARLAARNRSYEVMLGYSDSSKDAGPTAATLVLHATQARLAAWARENAIDLILMHGRGGAVGRGGGPANRAVLAQPEGSVNCVFKLTEQGEVIEARYGNPVLACRHIESVAGATLAHASHVLSEQNTAATREFAALGEQLAATSAAAYTQLLETPGFVEWFSTVTPLEEIGLLPLGSRPSRRGLSATTLEDLRAIPWIFAWSQARLNLAAWYGLGSACEAVGDLDLLQKAYQTWPLFSTFIDNVDMSLAKADARLGAMYLALGSREDLAETVLGELERTKHWVLAITQSAWPLEHRHVLGPLVRARLPFVNVLSLVQVRTLKKLRSQELTSEERAACLHLVLCTVSGVAAGLQNTG
jgi:phosphoenolpyruvate carboxylase